jgi:hypothetical protein
VLIPSFSAFDPKRSSIPRFAVQRRFESVAGIPQVWHG